MSSTHGTAGMRVPLNTLVAATRRLVGGVSVAVYGLVNSRYVLALSVIICEGPSVGI